MTYPISPVQADGAREAGSAAASASRDAGAAGEGGAPRDAGAAGEGGAPRDAGAAGKGGAPRDAGAAGEGGAPRDAGAAGKGGGAGPPVSLAGAARGATRPKADDAGVGPRPAPADRHDLLPLEHTHRDALERLIRSTELFNPEEQVVALEVIDAYLNDPGKDYHALGAFTQSGALLGYACYGPTPCTAGTWDLYWIAVDGDARGRGIGTLLMEEIERRLVATHARLVLIETSSRPDYTPTRAFYERRGYQVVARIPDFYAPGDDRVIFARTFHSV